VGGADCVRERDDGVCSCSGMERGRDQEPRLASRYRRGRPAGVRPRLRSEDRTGAVVGPARPTFVLASGGGRGSWRSNLESRASVVMPSVPVVTRDQGRCGGLCGCSPSTQGRTAAKTALSAMAHGFVSPPLCSTPDQTPPSLVQFSRAGDQRQRINK
jgi:hypothetical protein